MAVKEKDGGGEGLFDNGIETEKMKIDALFCGSLGESLGSGESVVGVFLFLMRMDIFKELVQYNEWFEIVDLTNTGEQGEVVCEFVLQSFQSYGKKCYYKNFNGFYNLYGVYFII